MLPAHDWATLTWQGPPPGAEEKGGGGRGRPGVAAPAPAGIRYSVTNVRVSPSDP